MEDFNLLNENFNKNTIESRNYSKHVIELSVDPRDYRRW